MNSRHHIANILQPLLNKSSTLMLIAVASLIAVACDPAAETTGRNSPIVGKTSLESRNDVERFPAEAKARAESLFAAIKSTPENANKNGLFAMYAHAHGLADVAFYYYARAAQRDPETLDWPYLRGLLMADQGLNAAAIESLRQAAEIDPKYPPLRLRLAQLLIKEEQFDEAQTLLARLVAEHPNYPEARWTYGQYKLDQGEHQAAIEELNFAVAQVPHYGSAHYALAAAYRATGDDTKAATHLALFEKHRSAGPISLDKLIARVEDLRNTSQQAIIKAARLSAAGKFEQAINVFNKLLQDEPDNAVAHINLIGLYGELGQTDKAEDHYQAGLKSASGEVKLHNNYGVLMLKQNNFDKAAEAFQTAIKVDPEYATPYKYLGLSLQNLGQPKEAQKNFRIAFDKDPLDDQVGYFLGNSLMLDKQYDQAIEIFSKISTVQSPKSPSYLRAMARAYFASGDFDNTSDALNRARSIAKTYGQSKAIEEIDAELEQLANAGAATP